MVTTLGEVGPVRERKGAQAASGILVMFCFLIWILVTQVCSLCENLSKCTLMICPLFYMQIIVQ